MASRDLRWPRLAPGPVLGCMLALAAGPALPAEYEAEADLTQLSFDALMNIEVTSVSKHAEPLGRAAAAVYVITGEELRRSGARSIAEALRMVPGMNVARSNANTYSISARGFQSSGDKLQVLVDGRSVYTPLTSAVFWDTLDTDLGSIDRIEVIRGPGATLWGANAVNGVINIITRSAADTHGGEWRAAAGTEERASAALRAGTALGTAGDARFYAKAYERENAVTGSGAEALDDQRMVQGGLRTDWKPGDKQQLNVSGDLYSGRERSLGAISHAPVETALSGANLSARWILQTGERSNLSTGLSFDHYQRAIPEIFSEKRDTWDFGLQHQAGIGERNDLTYGIGYRNSRDTTGGPPLLVIFSPPARSVETYSAFAQDQMRLGESLVWTIGSKFEHNDLSGAELQPGTRLGWQVNEDWFSWAAVSRAVRTPNRLDHDIAIFCPPPAGFPGLCGPGVTLSIGNRAFDSEKLIAYEWGLRYAGGRAWSADLAAFYNDYRDLRSTETGGSTGLSFQNQLEGTGSGAELSVNWNLLANLDLRAFYSFLHLDINARPGSTDTSGASTIEGGSPRYQSGLRLSWAPLPAWSVDSFLRHVSGLKQTAAPSATSGPTSVPAYAELNLRLGYRPWPGLELALIGENLLDSRHPEYGASNTRSELERSVQLGLIWTWR